MARGDEAMKEYQVEVRQLGPCPLAVVRRRAAQAELSRVIPPACGEAWDFVRRERIAAGRNIVVYLSCSDGLLDIECGVEVREAFAAPDSAVVCSVTPAGSAAVTTH